MQYASVNSVYNIVKDAANANQRGFVTPSQFNTFCIPTQQQVFQDILSEYRIAMANIQRYLAMPKHLYNSLEAIQDDLLPLLRYDESLTFSSNRFLLPDDYAYYIMFTYNDIEIEVVRPESMPYVSNSFLAPPSIVEPIGVLDRTNIKVLPSTINSGVRLTYYKVPKGVNAVSKEPSTSTPNWGYNAVGASVIYNPSKSVDFELPKQLEYRLASVILSYVGVNMRDSDLIGFGVQKNSEETQE